MGKPLWPLSPMCRILGVDFVKLTPFWRVYSLVLSQVLLATIIYWWTQTKLPEEPMAFMEVAKVAFVTTNGSILGVISAFSEGLNVNHLKIPNLPEQETLWFRLKPILKRLCLIACSFTAYFVFLDDFELISMLFYFSFIQLNICQLEFSSCLRIVLRQWEHVNCKLVNELSHLGIRDILHQTDCLFTACSAINKSFGLQVLLSLTRIFVLSASITFSVILELRLNSARGEMTQFLFKSLEHCFILAIHVNELWDQLGPSQKIREQIEKFNLQLYTLALEDEKDSLSCMECVKNHLALKRDVKFTAAGFIDLDNTLPCGMVGTAVTYFFLLVQMT